VGIPQGSIDETRDVKNRIPRAWRAVFIAAAEDLELALTRCGTGYAGWDKNAPGDESVFSLAGTR
jgi:hypothetical protein